MNKFGLLSLACLAWALLIAPGPWALAQPAAELILPPRPASAGMDLIQALEARQSTRQFRAGKLGPADLSAILWAADGLNRVDGRRTAPSAHGRRYLDIFLVGDEGTYIYDAPGHKLILVNPANLKGELGSQAHAGAGSHLLVLVADLARMGGSGEREYRFKNAAATAGCVAQNVYLMCAARGVGTVIMAGMRPEEIRRGLKLAPSQEPLYIMPLGHKP